MEDKIARDEPESHSQSPEETNAIAKAVENTGPVPLSFPSILRNPRLTSRYAHLVEASIPSPVPVQAKNVSRRNDNEGKRWVRRRENGAPRILCYPFSLFDITTPVYK